MKLRSCEYCGTEYDAAQPVCPVCGKTPEESAALQKKKTVRIASTGGARMTSGTKAARDPDRVPPWLWALICAVLSLAVLIGIVAFVVHMGFFEEGFDLNAIPTNIEQTEVPQEQEIYPDEEEQTVEVEDKSCTDLSISEEELLLEEVDARAFLTAVASPADCEDEIEFFSSNEDIVTVSEDGMVTAVAPGEAQITVICGDVARVCTVLCDFELLEEDPEETEETEDDPGQTEETQEEEKVDPPVVVPDDFTLRTPGEEAYLAVQNVPDGVTVTFASADPSIVSVTADGKVRAERDGQTTIIITVGDVQLKSIARCNLGSTTEGGDAPTENQQVAGPLTISHSDVTFSFAGESFTISLKDASGKTVSGVSWASANAAVCTVSGSTVKAVGKGQTTVSATYNGTTYSCIIRCGF